MDKGLVDSREKTPLFMSDEILDHLKAAFLLLDQICLLRRFADGNNPETRQKPLPDGSNLESPALRSSWLLQRAWVRTLHYRSLHLGPHNYGVKQIHHILALSILMLNCEATRSGNGADELKNPPEFESLVSCANSLIKALTGVVTDLATEFRPAMEGVIYTTEETVQFNMDPKRLAVIYKAVRG